MLSRTWDTPPEDPSVAPVEELLEAAAARSGAEVPRRDGRLVVSHAVWLCACETLDDSPCWLIYAVGEDGVDWQRLPGVKDALDAVEAEHLTGCHPAPAGVLAWLRGERPYPWRGNGDYPERSPIYEELRRRILSS